MRMIDNGILLSRSHASLARSFKGSRPSRATLTLPLRAGRLSFDSDKDSLTSRRQYATEAESHKRFAVLGGGITGLATAKYLTDAFPRSKVTIFEKAGRMGGWMRSNQVETGDGEVIFEAGPRSLRPNVPNGTLALRLVESIGLTDSLIVTPKSSPSARNRFIYYPNRLVRLPGPGVTLWQNVRAVFMSGLFAGLPRALMDLDFNRMPELPEDESVGSYLSKRIGPQATNNIASAALHGIHAGDVWQLSAKSVLNWMWETEKRQTSMLDWLSSQVRRKEAWNFADDIELQMLLQEGEWSEKVQAEFRSASVFSFAKGVQELPDKLAEFLGRNPNVTFMTDTSVQRLERELGNGRDVLHVHHTKAEAENVLTFDHVVSTLPSTTTRSFMSAKTVSKVPDLEFLNKTRAVTVAVTTLHFPSFAMLVGARPPVEPIFNQLLQGFGYLIPNSVSLQQNPERALGVTFDSDITPDHWTSVPASKQGTKLTVMMGGHWWDGWDEFPSESDRIEMARAVLERHLGITEAPNAARSELQRECIPQYTVGHSKRMAKSHEALQEAFGGKLVVAGSWYTGSGVNDCLRAAFEAVHGLKTRTHFTGLEKFVEGRPMALVTRRTPGVMDVLKMEEGRGGRVPYQKWAT